MRIRFDKIDGFIKTHDKITYLVLFDYSYCDEICDKINLITDSINHNFGRVRIDSCNSLPIEKILTFHVIILIMSVVTKIKNKYFCNIFLEKGSSKDKTNTEYF